MNTISDNDWQPRAKKENLLVYARTLANIRQFLAHRNVLEVITPVLSTAGTTDPNIDSFKTDKNYNRDSNLESMYLRTSPEFHMKRLLAADTGDIYQMGPVFRDGESGSLHNPEFTLLEWYRVGFDYHQLMREVDELLRELLSGQLDLQDSEFLSYADAFAAHLNINPLTISVDELQDLACEYGLQSNQQLRLDDYLNFLMAQCIQPKLGHRRITFVFDFPASQCALARIRDAKPAVAERFEVFINGVELANGFHELRDAQEQLARFELENTTRNTVGKQRITIDQQLIKALKRGIPECSGVAIGIDRLIMLMCTEKKLSNVLAFDIKNA